MQKWIFIDVDLTLVDIKDNLRDHVTESLEELVTYGYCLVAWSHGGSERAEAMVEKHRLDPYFRAVIGKPDMIIDDSDVVGLIDDRVNKLRCDYPGFWHRVWDEIFHKDVGFASDQPSRKEELPF